MVRVKPAFATIGGSDESPGLDFLDLGKRIANSEQWANRWRRTGGPAGSRRAKGGRTLTEAGAALRITPYQPADRSRIRFILERIGWDEPYIRAFEQGAERYAAGDDSAVFIARRDADAVGFIFVEHRAWNRLAQIQGLAVDPARRRQGVASALAAQAEAFARGRGARGIYVDTPVDNDGGRRFYEAAGFRVGYVMPRYYGDALDGVTYQKFFDRADPGEKRGPREA
jgi:ribosomal protein S18 acetylase RimI-like enzyme